MSMKKILISIRDFGQGGIPRCLQSLMEYIEKKEYIVDIICLSKTGPYLDTIKCNKIIDCGTFIENLCFFSSNLNREPIFKRFQILICKVVWKFAKKVFNFDLMTFLLDRKGKQLSNLYDTAIAYVEGDSARIVSSMTCLNKLIWLHNDYKWIEVAGKTTEFDKFDKICCVSEATRNSFVEKYPMLENKTVIIYNLVNYKLIRQLSKEPIMDDNFLYDKFIIMSIGRVCFQKQFDVIPTLAQQLKANGMQFYWYIIGSGPDLENLKQETIERGVNDCVVFLGERKNPYNYLSKSNIFALTSRYESYPTVVNEAKVLGIPILSTDIPPIYEMLVQDEYNRIASINQWKDVLTNIITENQTGHFDFDFEKSNLNIMNEFYKLINGYC